MEQSHFLVSTALSHHRVRVSVHRVCIFYEGVVSKETVVLRRWGSSIQKFGFINGVDNVNWPPYRDILYYIILFRSYSLCTVANLHYQLR